MYLRNFDLMLCLCWWFIGFLQGLFLPSTLDVCENSGNLIRGAQDLGTLWPIQEGYIMVVKFGKVVTSFDLYGNDCYTCVKPTEKDFL